MSIHIECSVITWKPIDGDKWRFEDDLAKALAESGSDCVDVKTLYEFLLEGSLEKVLQYPSVQSILAISENSTQNLATAIQTNAEKYSKDHPGALSNLFLLGIGISSLQIFVQQNWTGPSSSSMSHLPPSMTSKQNFKDEIAEYLTVDGENIYQNATEQIFLVIARCILLDCRKLLQETQTSSLWLLRMLRIHQMLLEERSPTLKATIDQLIAEISDMDPLMTSEKYRQVAIEFHLEAGYLMNFYYNAKQAKQHFETAQNLAGLTVELTGVMGKRTRYQQKELSQLVLHVQKSGCDDKNKSQQISQHDVGAAKSVLPKNMPLDDETVFEKMKLSEEDELVHLSEIEQAVVLGLCFMHRKIVEGQGDIVREETLAYLDYVLNEPQNWCIQSSALLKRCQLEKYNPRRALRSMNQFEELIGQCSRSSPPGNVRLPLLYCSNLPPIWIVQKELAHLFESIEAMKAALEIYERLQMWEDVIKCYTLLGKKEKAQKLICEQLAIKETPTLYCYLGDVTNDPTHYHTAWELSNSRSARAQRSLGRHYLALQEFEKSVDHFEKSLELNALQWGTWYTYGCAALACQKFEKAAQGFRRCVNLDSESHEAWNNLASAYAKNNQKPRAFTTLQEAVKCDYENWRIWENLMVIAVDIGEFNEVIRAHHRLLDIKGKWGDAQILGILVKAVNEGLPNAQGVSAAILRPKLQELLGRVTAAVTTDADIWRHYAELLTGGDREIAQTDRERAVQYLQKSHRCSTQSDNWEREIKKCCEVAGQSVCLGKAYLKCAEKMEEHAKAIQLLSSARLLLKGTLTKIKQKHTDPATGQMHADSLVEFCNELEKQIQLIIDTIEQRKGH